MFNNIDGQKQNTSFETYISSRKEKRKITQKIRIIIHDLGG